MSVNMMFLLVSLIANAIYCSGLPQNYYAPVGYNLPSCDEAGDQFEYSPKPRQPSMMRNAEIYRGNQPAHWSSSAQGMKRGLVPNYFHQAGIQQMPLANADASRVTSFPNPQYGRSLGGYGKSQLAYDYPYGDGYPYYGGLPYPAADEIGDYDFDCPNEDCYKSSSRQSSRGSSKKLNKMHDKRHNSRAEEQTADEVDEENDDKDSWGISRREQQKHFDEDTSIENVKGKRSAEEKKVEVLNVEEEKLGRMKKEVKQVDTEEPAKETIKKNDGLIHQIMRIPSKTE